MRIKVCGLKEPENIKAILELPIDFIGLIFYEKSPRFVQKTPEDLAFLKETPIKKVGVFVNSEIDNLLNCVHDYELDFVQLHGNESVEFCQMLKDLWRLSSIRSAKIIKAFSIDNNFDFEELSNYERYCDLFLFDTKGKHPGGNGVTFDWFLLHNYKGITPFLLSGGIDESMAEQIKHLNFPQMYGVDINSKFETAPGLKAVEKVKQFVEVINS